MYAPSGLFRVRGTLVARRERPSLSRGRRIKNVASPDGGRYVGSRLPAGKPRSLAVDATLRAAAPHQLRRRAEQAAARSGGPAGATTAILVRPPDLREKRRTRTSGVSLLFAVDASGSMGAEAVMARAKGIVLSLLADAYQKRDRVGLLAFRGTEARVVLPFTTSVGQAQRRLGELPTGGKSPLALALAKSLEIFGREARKHPGRTPLLVLLTDGRANISMEGRDPFEEALTRARRLRAAGIRSLVVDTDQTWIDFYPYPRVLAEALGAPCLPLRELERGRVIDFMNLGGGPLRRAAVSR